MPDVLTCGECGAGFTPRADLRERFPGWQPRTCPSCFRSAKRGASRAVGGAGTAGGADATSARADSGSAGSARTGARKRTRRGSRGSGREELLTVAEVLERYHDGPDTGVFTDGSSIPNPGPGGWGAVYVRDGQIIDQAYGHDPDTTNNRMELRALQAALELVPEGTPARVHTDSNLAVRTITEWAAGWERRGWVRKTGPVENLDLVKPLYEAFSARPELELVWIRAHVGNRWNEYADALATAWARDEL